MAGVKYIYANGQLLMEERDGVASYYTFDADGSTTGLYDTDGNARGEVKYDAWGNILSNTLPAQYDTPFKFIGRYGYYDDGTTSGLKFLRRRYYSTDRARFQTADPIGYSGGQNLYAYVDNRPTFGIDPSGLWFAMGVTCKSENDALWTFCWGCNSLEGIARMLCDIACDAWASNYYARCKPWAPKPSGPFVPPFAPGFPVAPSPIWVSLPPIFGGGTPPPRRPRPRTNPWGPGSPEPPGGWGPVFWRPGDVFFRYGRYCGGNNPGYGEPIDCIDAACWAHDQCYSDVGGFLGLFSSFGIFQCDEQLCAAAKSCIDEGCSLLSTPDPARCVRAAICTAAYMCNDLDLKNQCLGGVVFTT
jgi:RHS repeat-associated protein